MAGSAENLLSVSIFEPALNWNWLLVVQRRGSNSLDLASGINYHESNVFDNLSLRYY